MKYKFILFFSLVTSKPSCGFRLTCRAVWGLGLGLAGSGLARAPLQLGS